MDKKRIEEIAAAAMAAVKERALSGGRLDVAQPIESAYSPTRDEPGVTIGRWYVSCNIGSQEQFVQIANENGITVSSRPDEGMVAVRRTDEATYLLMRPCKDGEKGLKVNYSLKGRSLQIHRLHAFLKRNKLVPEPGTVLIGSSEIGTDRDFGHCLIINVTAAKIRPVEKRPKKKKNEQKENTKPNEAQGNQQNTEKAPA